jgi:hypothetical protein
MGSVIICAVAATIHAPLTLLAICEVCEGILVRRVKGAAIKN